MKPYLCSLYMHSWPGQEHLYMASQPARQQPGCFAWQKKHLNKTNMTEMTLLHVMKQ